VRPFQSNALIVILALVSCALSRAGVAATLDGNPIVSSPSGAASHAGTVAGGLVASYPFNGNANDQSGNGNHGTAVGATLAPDRFGSPESAYRFDGNNDYIRIPDSASLNLTSDLSISAWIRTDTGGRMIFSNMLEVSPHDGYSFRLLSDGRIQVICGNVHLFGTRPVTSNTWRHVAFTLTGTTGRAYVDGLLDATGTVARPTSFSGDQAIGASYTPFYFHKGEIDDVQVFNRGLSSAEVLKLAVPEPSGLCLLALAAGMMTSRRRRGIL
jgi:hypothetical protein